MKNVTQSACVISDASCRVKSKCTRKLNEREKLNVQYGLLGLELRSV